MKAMASVVITSLCYALAAALVAVALVGCATRPPAPAAQVITRDVLIQVPTPCNATVDRPAFPDTRQALRAAPDIDRAVRLLGAGRALRDAYIAALEGALAACRDPTALH